MADLQGTAATDSPPPPEIESEESFDDDAPTTEWVIQDEPLDLTALEENHVDLNLDIGEIVAGESSVLNVRGTVAIGDGKLAVNGWLETPDGGSTAARIGVTSASVDRRLDRH